MKKIYHFHSVLIVLFFLGLCTNDLKAVAYEWTGAVSQEWTNPNNWNPSGVPDIADDVTITAAGGSIPLWEELPGVRNFTITGGTFDLDGYFMPIYGTCIFSGGTVTGGTLVISGNNVSFEGTTLSCNLNITSQVVQFNGSTFNNPISITKVGGGNVTSNGGNTFNSTLTITNTVNSVIILGAALPDIFNDDVIINSESTGGIFLAHGSIGNQFNGDIIVTSVAGGNGVRFGQNGGTSTWSSATDFSIGGVGFNVGQIRLAGVTQLSTSPVELTSSGGFIYFETGTTLNSKLTLDFNRFYLNGATFNDTLRILKTSANTYNSDGGNTFNGVFELSKSANGWVRMGVTNPDTFNNDIYLKDSDGNGGIEIARNASGNVLNGNIYFCGDQNPNISLCTAGGDATLTAGHTINLWDTGFDGGIINLRNLTQLGSGTITLVQSTGNAVLNLLIGNTFNADLDISFPGLTMRENTFNGDLSYIKTAGGNRVSNGGNVFNGNLEISSSNAGAFYMSSALADTYNGRVTLTQTGNGFIYMSHGAGNSVYNDDVFLNSLTSSRGIFFGNGGGNSTFPVGTSIQNGIQGIARGEIRLFNVTYNDNSEFTLTGAGNANLNIQSSTIEADLNVDFPQLNFLSCSFNGRVNSVKSGGGNNTWRDNTFNGPVNLRVESARITLGALPDIFNDSAKLTASGAGRIYIANNADGTEFNGPLVLSAEDNNSGIYFGNGGGSSTLSSGNSLSVASGVATRGTIRFRRFTQQGTDSISLSTGSTVSTIYFEENSNFEAPISATGGGVYLNGSEFENNATFISQGTNGNNSGGCIFNGKTTISISSSSIWRLGQNNPDSFLDDVEFIADGTGARIYVANNSAGNVFEGKVIINSINGATGIRFCPSAGGTATLNAGSSFEVGSSGFDSGDLYITRVTQLGSAVSQLTLGGTSRAYLQQQNIFNGEFNIEANRIYLDGATYNANASFTMTGNTNISSRGGNIFNDSTYIVSTGTGNFILANSVADTFNAPLFISNSVGGRIDIARTVAGNELDDVIIESTAGSEGVFFCQANNGAANLNGSISIGPAGFTSGRMEIRNITQTVSEPISLTLSSSVSDILFETGNTFLGDLTSSARRVYLNGSTFNNASFTNQGTLAATCIGGNTFHGTLTLNHTGSNTWLFSNTNPDTYNGPVNANNSGSSILYLGHRAFGNNFNDDLTIQSTGSSQGIHFGQNNGSSNLASGATLSFGAGGFTSGALELRNFNQLGNEEVSLTSSSAGAVLRLETGTTFNGEVALSFPSVFLNGTTFNGDATLTQSGSVNVTCAGGNTFAGNAIIETTGTGFWRLANNNPDSYLGDATFRQTNNNTLYPTYNRVVSFNGDISTIGTTEAITFSANNNNGWIQLTGSSDQQILFDDANAPTIYNLELNKPGGALNLTEETRVSRNLTFTSGIINSSASALLILQDNISVTGASSSSFVNGPVRKIGNDAFVFPTGKGGVYRPISISAPSNTAHYFTAEFLNGSSDGAYSHDSKDASIETISQCEYWILDRSAPGSNVQVGLSFAGNCSITNVATLIVTRWDGTSWRDHGNGGTSGNGSGGTILSSGAISSFSPFAVGSNSPENPLPIELISFDATAQKEHVDLVWSTATETNNHYFIVEKSSDLEHFELVERVEGAGNSTISNNYEIKDNNPIDGLSYYRLTQFDYNGEFEIFDPVPVVYTSIKEFNATLWPNPAKDLINVELINAPNELINLAIIDEMGRVVETHTMLGNNLNLKKLNLSSFRSGVYTLLIYSKSVQVRKRFVKN